MTYLIVILTTNLILHNIKCIISPHNSPLKFSRVHRKIPLLLSLVNNFFLKEADNHENIFIPVGTAIINVAAVK